MRYLKKMMLAAVSVTALGGATAVSAQAPQAAADEESGLEEIVVTANRREENLQKVALTVNAIGGSSLDSLGIRSAQMLTSVVPGISLTRSGPAAIFFIRGVGNQSGSTGEEGANAIYIDGVYLADTTVANAPFNNVQRVEVLKGPQGTLFGRNASGGLINIITKDPGDTVTVNGSAGYGNYNTFKGNVYMSAPITDKLAADFAAFGRDQKDGWGRNVLRNVDAFRGYVYGFRSKWVWKPNDATKVTFAGDYYKSRDNYTASTAVEGAVLTGGFRYVGDYNTNSDNPRGDYLNIKAGGIMSKAEFDVGWGTITNIIAYRGVNSLIDLDSDASPLPLIQLHIPTRSRAFQEELRFASNTDGPFDYQIGVFYFRNKAEVNNMEFRGTAFGGGANYSTGNNLTARMITTSFAGFAEGNYKLTDTTTLTAGVRYTKDKRHYTATQRPVNQTAPALIAAFTVNRDAKISPEKVTYRFAVRQEINDDINVYASYNRGFKSGIFAMQAPTGPPVKPQTIDAFEAGFKSELADRRVRINAAYFHYKIKDYQVRSAANATASPVLLNAGSVKVDGVEGEINFAPSRAFTISANATYLNSRFGSFPFGPDTFPTPASCTTVPKGPTGPATGGNVTCISDLKGRKTPLSPKFTASIRASYELALGGERSLTLNALYNYTSKYAFEPDNRLVQGSFGKFNASAEFHLTDNWSVELWAENLFDRQTYERQIATGTGDSGELLAPRTYGLNVKFDF